MRYVIIGASGHYNQVIDAIRYDLAGTPDAIAPGCEGEDVSKTSEMTGIPLYTDWRKMVDEVKPDMVVVNSWYGLNAAISCECLERGIHVYSEKPAAGNLEELARLREVWKASGREFGTMMGLNCCGWYRTIEKAVMDGEIGEVRFIHGQKSYRMGTRPAFCFDRDTYTGTIPWVAIHAVDWVLRLGGKCECVSAVHTRQANRGNGDMESAAAILMQMENGVIGTVDADLLRPDGSARHDDDRLRVTGTRGMVEAINGRVWLENEERRRELDMLEDVNPFVRFINGFGTDANRVLAEQAFEDARICLFARTAADAGISIKV